MDILKLIVDASLVVKLVLLLLLFFSVLSWAIIFFKRSTLKRASAQSKKFMRVFRKSKDLHEVNEAAKKFKSSPEASLFLSGFKVLSYVVKSNPETSISQANIETINRALIKASNREINRFEKMMNFLATAGSVTPFIGLFGTVWGIMDSFHEIGIAKSASLVTVAPGIAEALIATALGLFAAIPAVISYNYFLHLIKERIMDMEDFSIEFISIAERLYGI
ncbi:MAG: protein TolQ [Candidatus Aminicenantes bacterium]|nr:protein TolQ [Candidatus Aminicenantes bacterium]